MGDSDGENGSINIQSNIININKSVSGDGNVTVFSGVLETSINDCVEILKILSRFSEDE